MSKPTLVSREMVNGYTPVHPALDFWEGRAIVSIGQQIQYNYDNGDIDFRDGELTVLSDGDHFLYDKKELALRKLYYSRALDLPMSRWEHEDAVKFCKECKDGSLVQVGIKDLYQQVKDEFAYYMDFDRDEYYDILACFVIYSYFYPLFTNAPIVQLWGNLKTGKSKTISLLDAMAFNPINSANISEATVFRVIEGRRAILLLDESEDLMSSERGKAISNLLLAGYSACGETYRQEKTFQDRYKTTAFRVFSPKIIANIEGVSLAPLKSRIIRLVTTGALDKTRASRAVNLSDKKWKTIRNNLYRLTMTIYSNVIDARDNLPVSGLSGRELGIWEGILTIASLTDVWDIVLSYAIENTEVMKDELREGDTSRIILSELLNIVTNGEDGFYSVGKLWRHFSMVEDSEITTKRALGNSMKRLGFSSKLKKSSGKVYRGYDLFEEKVMQRLQRYE